MNKKYYDDEMKKIKAKEVKNVKPETESAVKEMQRIKRVKEIPPHMKQGYPQAMCIGLPQYVR